jgi:ATP-dependent DNA helicase RecQ
MTGNVTYTILRGVELLPFPLGRTGLARALQGAASSPVQADRFPLFGALSTRTQKSIGEQILLLKEQGLLAHFVKGEHQLLRLTDKGKCRLAAHPQDRTTTGPPAPQHRSDDPAEVDQTLLRRLRAWRLEKARELAMPPYVIFHDAVLERIAASRPTTRAELATIKGVGPRKLEQFGPAIVEIVTSTKGSAKEG